MDSDYSELFQEELNPGEQIIWTGRPKQGFLLRPAYVFVMLFGLLFSVLGIVFEFLAFFGGGPVNSVVLALPLVLLGFYFLFGGFLVDIAQRRKTYYALTTRRAIIVTGRRNRVVRTFVLSNMPGVYLDVQSMGSGTISFGVIPPWVGVNVGNSSPGSDQAYLVPGFVLIEDVRKVYQEIVRLQAQNT